MDRNVTIEPSERGPADLEGVSEIDMLAGHPDDGVRVRTPSPQESEDWHRDLKKCETENVSVFWNTIMMGMIQRHRLRGKLGWTTQSEWCSASPPAKSGTWMRVDRPKPDLMLAFQTRDIIQDSEWELYPAFLNLEKYFSPESSSHGSHRAFPFCFIEATSALVVCRDLVALHQCLNVASHALHNIWMFLRETENGKDSMKSIRVYSISAGGHGIVVRAHWVQQLKYSGAYAVPDYPWSFEYVEVKKLAGGYEKAEVCRLVSNILFEYGIKTLLPQLQRATSTIAEKAEDEGDDV